MTPLPKMCLPEWYNYCEAFLTLECNLSCPYCLNRYYGALPAVLMNDVRRKRLYVREMNDEHWVDALNRIEYREDLPITLGGGEPTARQDFYEIVRGIYHHNVDLLTNGVFNSLGFVENLKPEDFSVRACPYPPIRISCHCPLDRVKQSRAWQNASHLAFEGFRVGVYAILAKEAWDVDAIRALAADAGAAWFDFRAKEFLGMRDGVLHGSYMYPEGLSGEPVGVTVQCRNNELLIAPTGTLFRCHRDLYKAELPAGHILDPDLRIQAEPRECRSFGECHPCDMKLKTNRFQQDGNCSMRIEGYELFYDRDARGL
mgnify:CR=1 FL=1